jgi:hypothetical protein
MDMAYLLIFVAVGLLADWALYSRLVMTLCMPAFYGRSEGYTDELFPRVIASVAGVALVFFAGRGRDPNIPLLICGAVMFGGSVAFGVFQFMRHN